MAGYMGRLGAVLAKGLGFLLCGQVCPVTGGLRRILHRIWERSVWDRVPGRSLIGKWRERRALVTLTKLLSVCFEGGIRISCFGNVLGVFGVLVL